MTRLRIRHQQAATCAAALFRADHVLYHCHCPDRIACLGATRNRRNRRRWKRPLRDSYCRKQLPRRTRRSLCERFRLRPFRRFATPIVPTGITLSDDASGACVLGGCQQGRSPNSFKSIRRRRLFVEFLEATGSSHRGDLMEHDTGMCTNGSPHNRMLGGTIH